VTITDAFDVFLIDLDGVVYVEGDPLPGAVASLRRLADLGKEIRYLTNDPRPRRQAVARRLTDLGIEVDPDEIVTSGWAAACYLRGRGVTTASTVGSDGLSAELRAQGLRLTEDGPEAVVVGADEHTSYRDIRRAARHIDRGATFVGTNPDGSFPTSGGPAPGAGAIVRAVETATGVAPVIVGKPEPLMFEMALEGLPEDRRAVVVGDNAETDVLGAHRAGLTGVLVAENEPPLPTAADFRRPDGRISGLPDLFEASAEEWRSPGFTWPDRIRPGVAAVVLDDSGRVLLVKRSDREQWALPTGSVEAGESLTRALAREVREETGLAIEIRELTGVYSAPEQQVFVYPSGRAVHFVTCCFRCAPVGEELTAHREEVVDAGFFPPDALPPDVLPMQPRWVADAISGREGTVVR
jgi:HAD superfamily hydrolase (TIGR01450 family)